MTWFVQRSHSFAAPDPAKWGRTLELHGHTSGVDGFRVVHLGGGLCDRSTTERLVPRDAPSHVVGGQCNILWRHALPIRPWGVHTQVLGRTDTLVIPPARRFGGLVRLNPTVLAPS